MPPTELIILDNQGATMTENTIGPYREGVSINVTCMSSGGIPVSNMQMKFHFTFSVFTNLFLIYVHTYSLQEYHGGKSTLCWMTLLKFFQTVVWKTYCTYKSSNAKTWTMWVISKWKYKKISFVRYHHHHHYVMCIRYYYIYCRLNIT